MKRVLFKSAAVVIGLLMLCEVAVLLTPQSFLIDAFSR